MPWDVRHRFPCVVVVDSQHWIPVQQIGDAFVLSESSHDLRDINPEVECHFHRTTRLNGLRQRDVHLRVVFGIERALDGIAVYRAVVQVKSSAVIVDAVAWFESQ